MFNLTYQRVGSRLRLRLAGAVLSGALLVACATANNREAADAAAPLVWPPAPAEPRVRFVQNIVGPLSIGQSASVLRRFSNFLIGDSGERENLVKPFGVALDESGNLCVTDMGAGAVCYCDFRKKKWQRWFAAGKTRFAAPVAVARRNGVFYVADSELGKVLAFREDGRSELEIAAPLQRPVGVAIAGDSLFVADSQAHAVFVFDLRGQLRFQFGKRGAGAGEFNFPTHISADGRGQLFVTDSLNSRVQVFDEQGRFQSQIGSAGDTSGHFGRPKGAAADTFGHLYVADAVYDNVQVFALSGGLLLNWGQAGTGPGEFGMPGGVVISPGNQIYVADSFNHRVQVFQYLGQP